MAVRVCRPQRPVTGSSIAVILAAGALAAGLATAPAPLRAQSPVPPAARPAEAGAGDMKAPPDARPTARPSDRPEMNIPPAPTARPESAERADLASDDATKDARDASAPEGDAAQEDAGQNGSAPQADRPETAPASGGPTATEDASTQPVSQGRLIPPEEMPPLASPVPEQLRESDFDDAACRLGLRLMGVEYQQSAPITDPAQRDCGIARPVVVTAILPGIALDTPAPMRCETARQLARWTGEIVLPAAAHLPGAPRPIRLEMGSTYHCRGVVGGTSAEKLSEHALGNAIDIAAFGFDDGARLPITPPGDRGDMAVAFQNAVQASACLFFTTVLGPGSNAAHDDHLHLDIKARRGGFRLCQ